MSAITQLRRRRSRFQLRMRLTSASRPPVEVEVELVRGLAPFPGGGKIGPRFEGLGESLH